MWILRRHVAVLIAACALAAGSGCGPHPAATAPVATSSATTVLPPIAAPAQPQATTPPHPSLATNPAAGASAGLRFVLMPRGAGWSVLLPVTPARVAQLARVAALLRAATPIQATPWGQTCGPAGFRLLPAAPPGAARWQVGLANGGVLTVLPDVAPCDRSAVSYTTDAYASLGGQAVHAAGLVPLLSALTASLPAVVPLSVSPASAGPGSGIQVSGAGWVGGTVDLSVFWCRQAGRSDCATVPLAKVVVARTGALSWAGSLPKDLPASGYEVALQGSNAVVTAVLDLRLQ